MKEQQDISQIKFTLKYGNFDKDSRGSLIGAIIFLVVVILIWIVPWTVFLSEAYFEAPSSIYDLIVVLIVMIFLSLILPAILFFIAFRHYKIKEEVVKWLEDSIQVDAYIKTIDTKKILFSNYTKFQIDFDIEENHYSRTSEEKRRSIMEMGMPKGYLPNMSEIVDNNIKIMYSPKFDQVIVLES